MKNGTLSLFAYISHMYYFHKQYVQPVEQERFPWCIIRLANLGKRMLAGPSGDAGNWRGIFIFDVAAKEAVAGYLKLILQPVPGKM